MYYQLCLGRDETKIFAFKYDKKAMISMLVKAF
jgi:hypothetical protein